ncbi:hypothetical protein AB3S75_010128 [Citrus x aurantiifolia]
MINGENAASSSELLKAQAQVWNCAFNYVNSMSLKCVVELGIADIIHSHGQPTTLSQIASALDIKPNKVQCIQSVMRILVHSGFFAQQNDDEYFLTPASRLLLKDTPLKAAPFVDLVADPLYTTAFHCLGTWLQNDDPTLFETAHGKKVWDRVADEPKFKSLFYDLMITDSELIAGIVIKDCKEVFEGLKSLIDVAGGTGIMARAIATAFPDIKCTVFDLPHVVDNLQGTNDNLDFLGGNMFEAIPQANAVLLKWILHNWNDEESVKLLKKCKEAIPSKDEGGKVIIIDMAIENQSQDKESMETQLCFDILMVSLFRGKERSVDDWKKLFLAAGFSHYKITPILGVRSLIEAYP